MMGQYFCNELHLKFNFNVLIEFSAPLVEKVDFVCYALLACFTSLLLTGWTVALSYFLIDCRYHSRRSRSRDTDSFYHSSGRRKEIEDYVQPDGQRRKSDYKEDKILGEDVCEDSMNSKDNRDRKRRTHRRDVDRELFDDVRNIDKDEHRHGTRKSKRWQDGNDRDRDEPHHSTGKSSRRYNRNHKSRTSETDSDERWSDRDKDKDKDKDRHHERSSESSKKRRKAVYLDDCEDDKYKRSQTNEGKERETYHGRRRKRSRHHSKNSDRGIEGDWSDKDENDDGHHSKRRKSSGHSGKVPKVSDNHKDSKNWNGTDLTRQRRNEASDISDDNGEPGKRTKTSVADSSTEITKADTCDENLILNWSPNPSSSYQDQWEFERCSVDIYHKSRGKVTSSGSPGRYEGGKKSFDYDSDSPHDKIDHEGDWKSEEVTSKHRKYRRKSGDLDSLSSRSTKIDKENRSSSSSKSKLEERLF